MVPRRSNFLNKIQLIPNTFAGCTAHTIAGPRLVVTSFSHFSLAYTAFPIPSKAVQIFVIPPVFTFSRSRRGIRARIQLLINQFRAYVEFTYISLNLQLVWIDPDHVDASCVLRLDQRDPMESDLVAVVEVV